ncbi:MAG TPA: LysR family transcriptional regulator [Stellaceae bacterium]|nr:LysR family transcriptional regulator [Stellaceae bacterium]
MDRLDSWTLFTAVAEQGSFVEAARRLARSPQSVTRAVAALEERLGTRLFNRTTRSVTLTDAGARYLERCRHVLAEFNALETSLAGEQDAPRGILSITAPVVFGRLHILPIVRDFLREHPAVDVRLSLWDRVVSLVDEGIDLGVRIGDMPDSSLKAIRVGQVFRALYASPKYLARHGTPARPEDLADHTCIAFSAITPVVGRWSFGAQGGGASIAVKPRLIVNTAQAAIDAAIAGFGITRVLSYMADHLVAAGKLRLILQDYEPKAIPVQIIHPAGRHLSPKVRLFVDKAVATIRAKYDGNVRAPRLDRGAGRSRAPVRSR